MSRTPITPMRLDADVVALLDELAGRLETTRTEVVRQAVRALASNGNRARPARCTRTPACLPRATAPWLLISPALAMRFCVGCRRRWAEAMLAGMA